jgi:Na+/H+ antiporter NhaA
MRAVWMAMSLLVLVPAFAVLGAGVTLDTREPVWIGLTAGIVVGVFFGLGFGGVRGRWVDAIFGPEDQGPDGKTEPE